MNPSDEIRRQADEAEQRGLAFFNKLSKQSPGGGGRGVQSDSDDLRLNVDSTSTPTPTPITRRLPTSSTTSASRHKLPPRFSSPPSSSRGLPGSGAGAGASAGASPSRHISSNRRGHYSDMYSPSSQSKTSTEITVSFSFFIRESRIPGLSLTLHCGLTVAQVKVMIRKKITTHKEIMPTNLVLMLDGRKLRDELSVGEVPVPNGAHLKVYSSVQEDHAEFEADSFMSDRSSSVFETPQAKGGLMRGGQTPMSGVPSSIKPSPYTYGSSPLPADMSDFSFRATTAQDQMRNLHHPFHSPEANDDFRPTGRQTSVQKTTPGGAVMSEEASFYEIIENVMEERPHGISGHVRCEAVQLGSVEQQSHLAELYAEESASRYEIALNQLSLHTEARLHQHLLRDLEDLRAERDMWSLASRLLTQGLLKDVEDTCNEDRLDTVLREISPSASLEEVINRSIQEDERLKKGRVLKDWVESCNADMVHAPCEPPSNSFPWAQTLQRLKKTQQQPVHASSPTCVSSIHPDSQIGPKGSMVALDRDDHTDQETLLKVVWQHIRCGQLVKAQTVANEHNVHWLTAALMGVAEEFFSYDEGDVDEGEGGGGVIRRGNKNRPLWVQVCWKYAAALDGNAANKTIGAHAVSRVSVLESTIYAALSTNYSTLKKSILLQSYADHLWAKVKCAHERQIAVVTNQFRMKRREFSKHYPGTSDKVVAAERKYLNDTSEFRTAFSGNSMDLFDDMQSYHKSTHSSIRGDILSLQEAMMQGMSAIKKYISTIKSYAEHTILKCAKLADKSDSSAEQCRLMRIYVHFLLWLRFSCQEHQELRALVSDDVLHLTLEAYIARLAQRHQFSLMALYCSYLNRPKRIGTYIAMLRVISPTSVRSEEGHIVPAATLHMGGSASLAATLTLTGRGGGMTGPLGAASSTCMSLSGRNTGYRGVDDDATALEVLTLAKKFFDEEDIIDITNAVVDMARKGVESKSSFGGTVGKLSETFKQTTTAFSSTKTSGGSMHATGRSMSYASQTASTTVVPGVYDEGVIPREDAERMEALRWLCYYDDQCADAAKEANAFLRSFMIDSSGTKTLQLRVLLTNILPSNFITVGTESLNLKLDHVEDEFARKVQTDSWDADVGQLELWKYADWSTFCFEKFEDEVQDFYTKRADYVGDARTVAASLSGKKHQILRSAEKCLKSIRKVLQPDGDGGDVNPQGSMYFDDGADHEDYAKRGGFLAMWCNSIDSIIQELVYQVTGHMAEIDLMKSTGGVQNTLDQGDAVATELLNECFRLIEALEVEPKVPELSVGTPSASLFSCPEGLNRVKDDLQLIRDKCSISFATTCLLEKARNMLIAVQDNRKAMQLLAYMLLRNYGDVCARTAAVLEELRAPMGEVILWHNSASGVAVMVADEASNMQLYKALALDDLKRLLTNVATAHTHILRIQKSFDVFSK